ncbi:unnamed protein product, partial [Closterium sp. Naga37s-1]
GLRGDRRRSQSGGYKPECHAEQSSGGQGANCCVPCAAGEAADVHEPQWGECGSLGSILQDSPHSTRVIAIYDDMDLDVASMKLLAKGGHGGHNGMKSIMQHFQGSRNFPRLRF